MTFRHGLVVAWAAASVVTVAGCGTPVVTSERRADGIFHLRCKTALPRCLDEAEVLCDHQRYVVLRAFDEHDYKGRDLFPHETRDSQAFIRCGIRGAWGSENAKLRADPLGPGGETPPAATPPAALAPAAPARVCTPGASQACVGKGGCSGGQACLTDGMAFGPCDCGGSAP